jgi:CelD/BcsL family acetyltransferase involved in cellulose biosynthesis
MPYAILAATQSVQADWELIADATLALPWSRPGWVLAWWRAFGTGTLGIHAVLRDGQLVAVLPLASRHGALVSPTNWHTPEFGGVAVDDDAARVLAAGVLGSTRLRVDLAFVDPTAPVTRAIQEQAHRVHARVLQRSPYVELTGRWEDYERSLSGNLRRNVKRRGRRLHDAGEVTVDYIEATDDERLDALLDEGFRVEAAGWKGSGGTAIASRPETDRFYRDVAHWAARRGTLRLAFLRLDGRAIAFQLALEENGIYHFLKGGYDEAFHRFAPSKLLVRETLITLWQRDVQRFDFLGPEMEWKAEWARETRERVLMQAFAPGPLGAVENLAYTRARPIVSRLAKRARAGVSALRPARPRHDG